MQNYSTTQKLLNIWEFVENKNLFLNINFEDCGIHFPKSTENAIVVIILVSTFVASSTPCYLPPPKEVGKLATLTTSQQDTDNEQANKTRTLAVLWLE